MEINPSFFEPVKPVTRDEAAALAEAYFTFRNRQASLGRELVKLFARRASIDGKIHDVERALGEMEPFENDPAAYLAGERVEKGRAERYRGYECETHGRGSTKDGLCPECRSADDYTRLSIYQSV